MVFEGTANTTAISTASQNATDLISFSITPKTGSDITAKVGIFYGSTITYILYDEDITDGAAYIYKGNKIRILPNYRIFISVSATADFYFTIL